MDLRSAATLLLCLTAACDGRVAITDISMSLPEGDAEAGTRLDRLEIEVWPAAAEACQALLGWRRSVCGHLCTPAPSPSDRGGEPVATTIVRREQAGGWEPVRLSAAGQGPWELVVRGVDTDGAAFLHGCSLVSSTVAADVELFRPWCDATVCSANFHPACHVEIDCEAEPGPENRYGLRPPTCRAVAPVVWSWEQGDVPCPPEGVFYAPCRPARIRCEPGALEPEVDGICPIEEDSRCGITLEEDLDCDGRVPGPCGVCDPGDITECDVAPDGSTPSEGCSATTTCTASGEWGECVVADHGGESCGGGDEDCDGLPDSVDPDAVASCNAGRTADSPAADRCDAGLGCRCGDGPSCAAGLGCCWGACVDLGSSADHCGICGRGCWSDPSTGGSGGCEDGSSDCTMGDYQCCGGECVDLLTSPSHCGVCDRSCESDAAGTTTACVDGSCDPSSDGTGSGSDNPPDDSGR